MITLYLSLQFKITEYKFYTRKGSCISHKTSHFISEFKEIYRVIQKILVYGL